MDLKPHIFTAKVMHKRLLPKDNQFSYGVFYLSLPLSRLHEEQLTKILPINRKSLISFLERDHGARDGSNIESWIRKILIDYGLNTLTDEIILVAIPRIFNYVFNPVSFWMCFDDQKKLRTVLCEVNNTFGETHSYLCMHEDKRIIHATDWLSARKIFHVSPFLKREGSYRFRFDTSGGKLAIWIDYYNARNQKQLITALTGELTPLTKCSLKRTFWTHPLLTVKVITLIHWQALRLLAKGMRYISKPAPLEECLTTTDTPGKKQEEKC